ncbi:hypothetical protein OE88DRAFT_1469914 [Heliocybe sulcata]|uniref:Uncharacterized protein n=1 Tax=Heliocybe sulcata TaxID=5364 RepID=A0A5C3N481_9AGAM|nr:hypothetical protein OE88DRAFT_1469914 [Heliocybe sulcata]
MHENTRWVRRGKSNPTRQYHAHNNEKGHPLTVSDHVSHSIRHVITAYSCVTYASASNAPQRPSVWEIARLLKGTLSAKRFFLPTRRTRLRPMVLVKVPQVIAGLLLSQRRVAFACPADWPLLGAWRPLRREGDWSRGLVGSDICACGCEG